MCPWCAVWTFQGQADPSGLGFNVQAFILVYAPVPLVPTRGQDQGLRGSGILSYIQSAVPSLGLPVPSTGSWQLYPVVHRTPEGAVPEPLTAAANSLGC